METAMTLTTGATMGCSNNWLNAGDYNGNYNGGSALIQNTGCLPNVTHTLGYPWWQTYYYYTMPSDARPIKLKLSEIERLRKVAKADPKVKDILQKFTSQIEITVDFE